MRAAVYEGIGDIRVKDFPDPDLPRDGVLMKVRSAAICGTDVRTFRHGSPFFEPPWIIGHEIAGEVIAVDRGVSGFKIGDRVTVAAGIPCGTCEPCVRGWTHLCRNVKAHGFHYSGGFAELMPMTSETVKHNGINHIPGHVGFDEAALTEPLSCVLNGQDLVSVALGDIVVVIGAGPIGCMHVEVARLRGASKIFLIEVNPQRLRQAETFQADVVIDGAKEDAVAAVKKITNNRGADVVIVACPAKIAQTQAIEMAAVRGRISYFAGLPKADSVVPIDANILHYKELALFGAFASSPRQNKIALDMIATGRINISAIITHRLPLSEITQGIELVEKGQALKVVLHP